MEWVETTLGRVPVWGTFGSDRPLVLGIRGAFGAFDQLAELDPPGHDLALLHLPGMHSPPLVSNSIGTFIAAFDEVIRALFSGREITVVGLSVGSVVALGLRSPEVRAVLAVEPFFSTAKLWPLKMFAENRTRPEDKAWLRDVLGYDGAASEDRDFSDVLSRQDRPALSLVGNVPLLPFRPLRDMPSLTDNEDRARLPTKMAPGGHQLSMTAIRLALAALDQRNDHLPRPARAARCAASAAAAAGSVASGCGRAESAADQSAVDIGEAGSRGAREEC